MIPCMLRYGDLKFGDKFVILSSGKRCVKTAHGAISLEDGKKVLLFSTSAVRKIDDK